MSTNAMPRHTITTRLPQVLIGTVIAVFLFGFTPKANADKLETALKIAHILNVSKYVEWPGSRLNADTPEFVIGAIGDSSFQNSLEKALQGKKFSGYPIKIQKIKENDPNLADCHVLFIAKSKQSAMETTLANVQGKNVLTISDIDQFSHQGGMVELVQEGNKIQPSINLKSIKDSGLRISGKILVTATIVQ